MFRVGAALAYIVIMFFASSAIAADGISDSEIRQQLIGSWIVPSSSTDYGEQTAHVIETFKPDGTYMLYVFRDADCRRIAQKVQARWIIRDGILISTLGDGRELRDDVLSIENGKMTLHSLDDGSTYTRVKALTCSRATTS